MENKTENQEVTQELQEKASNEKNEQARGPIDKQNLVLTGLSASGKTKVGTLVAKLLGLGFVDLDLWIEKRAKKTVSQIFNQDGENAFRDLEKKAFADLMDIKSHVVAIGGGALRNQETLEVIKNIGTIIWLSPPIAELQLRLLASEDEMNKRPLLKSLLRSDMTKAEKKSAVEEVLKKQLAQREEFLSQSSYQFPLAYSSEDVCGYLLAKYILENRLIKKRRGLVAKL